jgi:hypothetical protein
MNKTNKSLMRVHFYLSLIFFVSLTACGDPPSAPTEVDSAPKVFDAAEEVLAVEETSASVEDVDILPPIPLEEARRPLRISLHADAGYLDPDRRVVIDVMEQDWVDLELVITDAEGRRVTGGLPEVRIEGTSKVRQVDGQDLTADDNGGFMFSVVGEQMGEDEIIVSIEEASDSAYLNVISLAANDYANLSEIEGVLTWDVLMQAEISWGEKMSAVFPPIVQESNGNTVKLAGFMVPLETSQQQSRFVLTSNPPSCFFHIPGGPAGAVEVLAAKPVAVTWEPVVLEGRFEALDSSEIGVAYRLHNARLVKQPK